MTHHQRQQIDQQLRALPRIAGATVDEQRRVYREMMSRFAVPDDIRIHEGTLADRRVLHVDRDREQRAGTILFVHGGSHVLGSPETEMTLTGALVSRTGYSAISLDPRLAPEHPFPADTIDVFAAYRALLDEGTDPATIAVAGDSAGGHLAVSILIQAKRAGLPQPAAAVLFSPGVDATRSGESIRTKDGIDPLLSARSLQANLDAYLAGADPRQELLSPAILVDPTGFPPLYISVGTNEVLLDDSTRLAQRARDHDVDVILDVVANVPHVFPTFHGVLNEADEVLDRIALFLRQRVG